MALTVVWGFLVDIIISAILMVLVVEAVGLNSDDMNQALQESKGSEPEVSEGASTAIASMVGSRVISSISGREASWLLAAISAIFFVGSFVALFAAVFGYDERAALGYSSLTLSALGIILTLGTIVAGSKDLALFGLFISWFGIVYGCYGSFLSWKSPNKGGLITNALGTGMGFVGAVLSRESYDRM